MRVLICGSRDWDEVHPIRRALIQLPQTAEIIHGAAPGADTIAGLLAEGFGFKVRAFPADWSRGAKGGPERNRRMLDEEPDLVIAFLKDATKSPGTRNTIAEAKRRGIKTEIVIG